MALSLTIGTPRESREEKVTDGRDLPLSYLEPQKQASSGYLGVHFCSLKRSGGWDGWEGLDQSVSKLFFCLVIGHRPIQGRQNKLKFRFSDQAIESHQLHLVEKTLDS